MYILVTFPHDKEFERLVIRALGHRGYLVTVCAGGDRTKVKTMRPEHRVGEAEHWALWWDPPTPSKEPIDGAKLVREIWARTHPT